MWNLSPEAGIPFLGIVFRGGGKSTHAELATEYVAGERIKSYGLYVCGTQSQANKHLLAISKLFSVKRGSKKVS